MFFDSVGGAEEKLKIRFPKWNCQICLEYCALYYLNEDSERLYTDGINFAGKLYKTWTMSLLV